MAPVWLLLAYVLLACSQSCPALPVSGAQLYGYEVVAEYPHDATAFTQGLEFDDRCDEKGVCREVFWESTGIHGSSTLRLVHVDSGVVEKSVPLERKWFGEGLARLGDKLYQLTWQTPTGFIYSADTMQQLGTFQTPLKDGWGITADDGKLVVSDGSATLTWLDPVSFQALRSVEVRDGAKPITYLNELEMIGGEVWANVWQTECIARIDPATGSVNGWLLMHGLRGALLKRTQSPHMDVLNGIAYDAARKRLFITGKLWPRIFEVVPVPLNTSSRHGHRKRSSCYVS